MQGDGNLVLYQGGTPLWATGTNASGAWVVMQADGNLVVYAPSCSGGVCWSSDTAGNNGAHLSIQGDGNLVIYGPTCSGACWASNSATVCN